MNEYIDFLQNLKDKKLIVDYQICGDDVYITPVVPINNVIITSELNNEHRIQTNQQTN
jgi:hypothetical protein